MLISNDLITFHGTSDESADHLINGKIMTSRGGGELGQGFYLGTELHIAKAWALQRFGCETVVEFRAPEENFWSFDIIALSRIVAIEVRQLIRLNEQQHQFLFGKDVVWAPIVGGPKVLCDQHKWESLNGQNFLNSDCVMRLKR